MALEYEDLILAKWYVIFEIAHIDVPPLIGVV